MSSLRAFSLPRRAGVLTMTAALVLIAGCGGQKQQPKMPPPAVGVMVAQPQQVPLMRNTTGRLSAYRNADVRARVSGVLLKRTYKEGTHVKKGQQLFQIDPAPLKAALDAAQASLAQARASYTNAKVMAERARKLAPKGYISKADLDTAESNERTSLAAVKAAKAKVEDAKINLGYASVTAPISGRAGKEQVTEGALVGQGSPTLLTTVRQIDPLYLNFSIPVDELQRLRTAQAKGQASLAEGSKSGKTLVHITLPDGSAYPELGTLDFSGMAVDPSTGAVTLRALVPNPKHVLLPGMYAELNVNMGTINHAYVIPQSAVLRDSKGAYVLTVGKDNKVKRTNVTTQSMRGGDWIVTQGITPGDHIIVSGIPNAKIGSAVKPKVEGQTPRAPAATGSTPAPAGSSQPAPTPAPAASRA
jgi:membrane fusion protein (multidrug efflux system)